MHSNCIKSLKNGFCEEQKGLKSDENLNSHIPANCEYVISFPKSMKEYYILKHVWM